MASVVIGLKDLCYAKITSDTASATVYGDVVSVADAIDAVITPTVNTDVIYADDGASESVSSFGDINISIEQKAISTAVQADWFGHTRDAKGMLVKGASDVASPIALGFRTQMANGKYAYKWLLKVIPQLSEETFHTKEAGSTTFQTRKVTLMGYARLSDGNWEYGIVDGEAGADSTVIANWFNGVPALATGGIIAITGQPTDATVTAGSITGTLDVTATITTGTLLYQWYSNTLFSNVGGTAIAAAVAASFTIPTTLIAGTYYYYCVVSSVGAVSVVSNAASVEVS